LPEVEGGDLCPLLHTGETHLWCWVQRWAHQHETDMGILETVQRRATKTSKGLKHLS